MKNPDKVVRWVTLLAGIVLVYAGSDGMLIDERIFSILVDALLIVIGIGLVVENLRGRPLFATNTNKLLIHAFSGAPGAFVIGVCLVRTIKEFEASYFTVMLLFGAGLVADVLWTRREVGRLGARETARKYATRFVWSCIFFSMISLGLGMQVAGFAWYGHDFLRRFGLIFWSVMSGIAVYPVCRDAKGLADAASPSRPVNLVS